MTFWIPPTKKALINWLTNQHIGTASNFNKMPKKQLYAIYFRVRKGEV